MQTVSTTDRPHVDARIEFWRDLSQWPFDCTTHVFLGSVVHDLGPLLFTNWTGDEPSTLLAQRLWPSLDTTTPQADIRSAAEIMEQCHAGYRARAAVARQAGQPPPMLTPEEWRIAEALIGQISDITWAAFNRFDGVVRLLVSLFQAGIVSTALRGHLAGGMRPIDPGHWINECFPSWFKTCQVDPKQPFSRRAVRFGGDWIFVNKASYLAWRNSAFVEGIAARQAAERAAKSVAAEAAHEPAAAAEAPSAQPGQRSKASRPEAVRRGGRKPAYDWAAFNVEAARRIAANGPPVSIRAFAEEMLEWCSLEWAVEPSQSVVRSRIGKLLKELGHAAIK